jgi:hypothetical protein
VLEKSPPVVMPLDPPEEPPPLVDTGDDDPPPSEGVLEPPVRAFVAALAVPEPKSRYPTTPIAPTPNAPRRTFSGVVSLIGLGRLFRASERDRE